MIIEKWKKSRNDLLGDNAKMELVSSENITVCRFDIKKEVELGWHSHEHEQITIVQQGEMTIEFDSNVRTMKVGDVCIIPGNEHHKADITKTPFKSYDIFCPIRQDFINKINDR